MLRRLVHLVEMLRSVARFEEQMSRIHTQLAAVWKYFHEITLVKVGNRWLVVGTCREDGMLRLYWLVHYSLIQIIKINGPVFFDFGI